MHCSSRARAARPSIGRWVVLTAALLGGVAIAPGATAAQRGRANYRAEVQPHLVLHWAETPRCTDDGFGVGGRASFPVANGLAPGIDDSLALGVGLDLSFFDGDDCYFLDDDTYDAWAVWVPFDVQWNIFFTPMFSAFMELGLAIERVEEEVCGVARCTSDSDIDPELVFWLGGRVHFTPQMAATLRLGRPSVLIGLAFFI